MGLNPVKALSPAWEGREIPPRENRGFCRAACAPQRNVEWKILTQMFSFKSGSSLTLFVLTHRGRQDQRVCGHFALIRPGRASGHVHLPIQSLQTSEQMEKLRLREPGITQATCNKTWQEAHTKFPLSHVALARVSVYLGLPWASLVLGCTSHCPRLGLVP